MNFNQLRYIISIDRFKNFTRAAEHCNIAQSTLSKEVQRLELEFGTIIFDRSRTPVEPTYKGKELIQLAQELLHKADEFVLTAKKKDNVPEGTFNFGILSGLAPYLLPLFIENIARKYPGIYLNITELGIDDLENQLSNNELDGAITIGPFKKNGYYESFLYEEEFVLYVSPEHYFFTQDTIHFSEIPFTKLKLHKDLKDIFIKKNDRSLNPDLICGLEKVNFQNGSLETIRKIIDHNGGIMLLPSSIKHFLPAYKHNRIKHISHPLMKQQVTFISPRYFQKERLIKVLKREIIQSISSENL